jgi:hypothetical protein
MAYPGDAKRLATCVAVAVALVGSTMGASAARAGTWMRSSCIGPGGTAAPSEGWSSSAVSVTYGSSSSVACSLASPMFALLSGAAVPPVGAHQTLQYTPPDGSTLRGGVVGVDLLADGAGYNASGLAAVYTPAFVYDGPDVVFQCAWGLGPCGNGTNHYQGPVTLPANRGGELYVDAACSGALGYACNAGGSDGVWARARVSYANLLLTSTFAPAGRDFRGSLLSPAAHGTASLAFEASVAGGPGIYKVIVTIDGKPVYDGTPNTNGGRCAPSGVDGATGALVFNYQQPCVLAETVDLSVRTTTLRDGPHELAIAVSDAAQNVETVLRQPITINNRTEASSTLMSDPPPGPDAAPVAAPGVGPEPVYALALDLRTRALGRRVRNVWEGSAITLGGTVRSSSGGAAAGVPVALFARSALDAAPRLVAQATSDVAGKWTLRAPRGPSRTLTISYGARPQPGTAGAIRIRQTVRPTVSMEIRPLGGGLLHFTGRLRFKPLGSPPPVAYIQTRTRERRWQILGRVFRVRPSGEYEADLQGSRETLGFSYAFRTVVPGTLLFGAGVSRIRRAWVL